MKNIIGVIGAGPAGIFAAIIAAAKGNEVYLIEKNNRIGKKLYITGKGRCNLTNSLPINEFFDNIMTNKEFLYSSLYTFTNEDVLEMLNKYKLKTKIERGNRVFPESDKSSDVIKTLNNILIDNKVNIILDTEVIEISKNKNKFVLSTSDRVYEFDKVVIATGGLSYPTTGSTGDGYKFAKKFGHTIVKPKASLIPVELVEPWVKELQGLSLKNVLLRAYSNNKLIHEEFGEMIFTHYGISGPIVLTTSNYLHRYEKENISFSIDLKPSLSYDKLNQRILRDFDEQNNKQFKNVLIKLLPNKLIPVIIDLCSFDSSKAVNQVTKLERDRLVNIIKDFRLTFKSLRPIREAIITSGGISTKEINPSTMESKLIDNLFFAGEVIDVDAKTGGFNLQIAYSTGYLAGNNI